LGNGGCQVYFETGESGNFAGTQAISAAIRNAIVAKRKQVIDYASGGKTLELYTYTDMTIRNILFPTDSTNPK
jgi:hypothetical protein